MGPDRNVEDKTSFGSSPGSAAGPYELAERLSVGGMAEVFLARDTRTGALVALKRIRPSIAEDEEFVRMFVDEATIAATLDHPNIAKLLSIGEEAGKCFLAYELVVGRDLRAIASADRAPSLPFLLHVFAGVAEGLAHAHDRPTEIVHRDVSPQNIMVSFTGDVKLIDFGIAKAKGNLSRTATGTIKGKLGYMSPEQVRGDEVDARTDVFLLGICMWELLARKRLFADANEILVLDMVKRHVPEPPSAHRPEIAASSWGADLDRIVTKALAKDPFERYRSARELARDLQVFIEKTGARATRADLVRAMHAIFGEEALARSSGKTMEFQETRMSDDNKGGSDLDIFEGLGKKSSARTSAAPPPPPGSGSGSGSHAAAKPAPEMKRTLLGVPGPALPPPSAPPSSARPPPPPASGSMRAAAPAPGSAPPPAASKPPPPPGRGTLPNIAAQSGAPPSSQHPPSETLRSSPPLMPPPAPSTRPTALATTSSKPAIPGATPSAKLDMEWDDDDEATHVFDKESRDNQKAAAVAPEARPQDHADMNAIMTAPPRTSAPPPAAGTPPPPAPGAPASLSGAFASLGQPQSNGSQAPSATFRSGPPPSQSIRSAPPPPPPSASQSPAALPAPAPPGQATTVPMHLPQRPVSGPPTSGHAQSAPPVGSGPMPAHFVSQPPMPQMPPVSRAPQSMEATALVPRQQPSKGPMFMALLVGIAAVMALAVFMLMPRTATLVVNVVDTKGAGVSKLDVKIDGTTKCETSPCILKETPAGVHEVRVTAQGFEAPAPRAITVEGRHDATMDFALVASKNAGGTGLKVSGNQPGVKLTVDGKEIGAVPQEVRDLEPGEHKLHFAGSERYQPLDKTISVGKDEIVDVGNVSLKVLKGKAMIQLGTPGAKVYLVSGTNRKEVPQFPIAIDFDPSEKWQLEAKLMGYDDFVQPITWDDGQAEKNFTVTLSPKSAARAATPAAPPAQQPAAAQPAPAQPAAAKEPTPAPASKPAAFLKNEQGGGDKPETPAPAAGEAFLNINSLPASTVVLDGKPLGATPRVKVAVSAGSHTILFVNSEMSLKKSITVNVGAGETKAAFAKLRE